MLSPQIYEIKVQLQLCSYGKCTIRYVSVATSCFQLSLQMLQIWECQNFPWSQKSWQHCSTILIFLSWKRWVCKQYVDISFVLWKGKKRRKGSKRERTAKCVIISGKGVKILEHIFFSNSFSFFFLTNTTVASKKEENYMKKDID